MPFAHGLRRRRRPCAIGGAAGADAELTRLEDGAGAAGVDRGHARAAPRRAHRPQALVRAAVRERRAAAGLPAARRLLARQPPDAVRQRPRVLRRPAREAQGGRRRGRRRRRCTSSAAGRRSPTRSSPAATTTRRPTEHPVTLLEAVTLLGPRQGGQAARVLSPQFFQFEQSSTLRARPRSSSSRCSSWGCSRGAHVSAIRSDAGGMVILARRVRRPTRCSCRGSSTSTAARSSRTSTPSSELAALPNARERVRAVPGARRGQPAEPAADRLPVGLAADARPPLRLLPPEVRGRARRRRRSTATAAGSTSTPTASTTSATSPTARTTTSTRASRARRRATSRCPSSSAGAATAPGRSRSPTPAGGGPRHARRRRRAGRAHVLPARRSGARAARGRPTATARSPTRSRARSTARASSSTSRTSTSRPRPSSRSACVAQGRRREIGALVDHAARDRRPAVRRDGALGLHRASCKRGRRRAGHRPDRLPAPPLHRPRQRHCARRRGAWSCRPTCARRAAWTRPSCSGRSRACRCRRSGSRSRASSCTSSTSRRRRTPTRDTRSSSRSCAAPTRGSSGAVRRRSARGRARTSAGAAATVVDLAGIYVHAKSTIVDDVFVGIGSANINRRGHYHDGEITVYGVPQRLKASRSNPVAALRRRLWAEMLDIPLATAGPLLEDPIAAAALFDRSPLAGNRFTDIEAYPTHLMQDVTGGDGLVLTLLTTALGFAIAGDAAGPLRRRSSTRRARWSSTRERSRCSTSSAIPARCGPPTACTSTPATSRRAAGRSRPGSAG